ncbi:MAG: GNAT family N-acetyltransferase [Chitinophagaceae bacterium]|nr:GNAT family N-acetyltransferase [Chitinophagaceae bacterium]
MVRLATPADLPQLSPLFDAYRVWYHKESDLAGATTFLSDRLQNAESIIFVHEINNELTGFTQLYPQFSSTRMKRSWLLNDLYVTPKFRGQGISKLLLNAGKQHAIETNAAGVLLETDKTNVTGNQLYPSAGFQLYDQCNFYWWNNNAC